MAFGVAACLRCYSVFFDDGRRVGTMMSRHVFVDEPQIDLYRNSGLILIAADLIIIISGGRNALLAAAVICLS